MSTYIFFSIIVPAHNEERLIDKTLQALTNLDYPKDHHEIIVIENGSTDATYEKCKKFESSNLKVFHLKEAGVSIARNFGQEHISPKTEWCVTVDADTTIGKNFLNELNEYLDIHPGVACGMAELTPDKTSLKARFWFWYRNQTDKMLRTMDTIHIVRVDLISKVKYDEIYHFTEDLRYAAEIKKCGKYFFMPTKNVISSTRRFEKLGYFKMFLKNLYIGIIYVTHKKSFKRREWEKIR